jgi:CheY-like chemotaxis protein
VPIASRGATAIRTVVEPLPPVTGPQRAAGPGDAAAPFIVALETDLFFSVRISDVAAAYGARAEIVTDAPALWEAIDCWPVLALIDLAAAPGWEDVVRRAKNLPHTRPIPIIAYGSHVDTEALQAARAAGCDHAWARSRFMAELPNLLLDALHPPLQEIAGCDEPPPERLRRGIAQFNAGEYWECHETLEGLWMAEPRPIRALYQGILQIGVAFHHLRERNYPGTLKMLRRGLPRLNGFPSVCQGVPVADLAQSARRIHDQVAALGPNRIGEFDLGTLPHIALIETNH